MQILAQLDQCKNFPDFNNYLATIFAQGNTLPDEVSLVGSHTVMLAGGVSHALPVAAVGFRQLCIIDIHSANLTLNISVLSAEGLIMFCIELPKFV